MATLAEAHPRDGHAGGSHSIDGVVKVAITP
jgi:hypothetical protein